MTVKCYQSDLTDNHIFLADGSEDKLSEIDKLIVRVINDIVDVDLLNYVKRYVELRRTGSNASGVKEISPDRLEVYFMDEDAQINKDRFFGLLRFFYQGILQEEIISQIDYTPEQIQEVIDLIDQELNKITKA